jgi:hypothetical protein
MSDTRSPDVPFITDQSPREELMAYIRRLEIRLDLDGHWFVETDGEGRHWIEHDQAERVEVLLSEFDRVGCQAETIAHLDEQNDGLRSQRNALLGAVTAIEALAHLHPENAVARSLGRIAAGALQTLKDGTSQSVPEAALLSGMVDALPAEVLPEEEPA